MNKSIKSALFAGALLFPILSNGSDLYYLESHTVVPYGGDIRSQIKDDFRAKGTLEVDAGFFVIDIEITELSGVTSRIYAEGNFTIDKTGTLVTVNYPISENHPKGATHTGIVICSDPLIIATYDGGFGEINSWRRANVFAQYSQ